MTERSATGGAARRRPRADEEFSFGRMVARALGAAVLVLILTIPLVWWLARTAATAALGVATGAVVVMLIVMALVARYELRGIQREIDDLKNPTEDPLTPRESRSH
ncbi:MAG: hypothetical protein QM809_12000 [Gordonia sp. (in: high G+C Gram-positive bacteria)]|uniref:hypothetical protein n=1 Tax=Gordonia sp. (in: high G+C Gram-positive bacteria) TaxID=84139 RepID=UPI0039E2F4B6